MKLKLNGTVEEIFELFEKTIAEYEEEFRRSKEACECRRDEEPDAVLKPRARLRRGTVVCPHILRFTPEAFLSERARGC